MAQQQALPAPINPSLPRNLDALLRNVDRYRDLALVVGILGVLGLLIVPLPPFMLDLLLGLSIALSVLILMVVVYISSPLDISTFPTILLVATLFRLGMNIASTRLILSEASAGKIIHAFGTFVVSGNFVVGVVVFLILLVINFVVIIKGSTRIAEVAARFTLDALPGKQMSIDADLNAGFIDEKEARRRREQLQREAEFYGAMDGASKFVKGDAIAGLVITGINILGGFAIGVLQRGMDIGAALKTYTILTIGDGLVSQVPALLVSVAAGLIISRTSSATSLDKDLSIQLTGRARPLLVVAGVTMALGLLPGFPFFPFALLSLSIGSIGILRRRQLRIAEREKLREELTQAETIAKPAEQPIEELIKVDPVEVEIGLNVLPLADEQHGGDLFRRIANIRRQLATELGVILPPVRVRDNLTLEPDEYVIKLRGNIVARNRLYVGMLLAMNPGNAEGTLRGIEVQEPVFGLPATWIPLHERENAELSGFTVVEPATVLATHLSEILRRNADKLLTRQDVRQLVEALKKDYPALVEEITPETLPLGTIQKVLQNLLREQIPIRDLPTILEALLEYVKVTKNTDVLTEYARHHLGETIKRLFQDVNGVVHAAALDPAIENVLTTTLQNNPSAQSSTTLGLSPDLVRSILRSVGTALDQLTMMGYQPLVICSAPVRPYLHRLIRSQYPIANIISYSELPPETDVDIVARIALQEHAESVTAEQR
ncbi:MAG: flagellar biosynthesis protein FlhA [Chlorobi bacterium]|nr:flagellar biosynthesis protein FlhA [Chlorobiota bacterium]